MTYLHPALTLALVEAPQQNYPSGLDLAACLYTRAITPKRVTSGGTHLRGFSARAT